MALIDKASLLMVPSTYEAGKLYNVLPSGNRAPDSTDQNNGYDQTRADFDFDRGSNTAATRIGSDGLIEKYRENLFTQSNNLTHSDWEDGSNTAISDGFADKDGGTNAFRLTMTSGIGTYFYQTKSLTNGGVYTLSFWAKANGSTHLYTSGDTGYESVPLTNEWQRFEFYFVLSTSTPSIGLDNNAEAVDCLIMNMQLESGLVATDVLTSGATTGKAGVLVDLPRINYDANGENGALLLEPSRQQLLQYSEYFGASYWTKNNVSVTDNAITSPEGVDNASLLIENTATSTHEITKSFTNTLNADYSISIFAKANTRDWIRLSSSDGGFVYFNLATGEKGTETNATGTIEPFNNGWYKCSIVFEALGTNGSASIRIAESDGVTSYTGQSKSIYIFGIQYEAGSYPSSYIPNHGESGGVTRAADSCSVTGASDVIGQTEGTLYAEINFVDNNTDSMFMTIGDGTSSNRIHIGYDKTSDWIYCNVKAAGLQQALITSSSPSDGIKKIAVAYKQNDYIVYINGVSVGADTNANVPTLTRIDIGGYFSAGFEYPVKQNLLFKERLSNAELATLTTL